MAEPSPSQPTVAIVTGAAGGIGRALAERWARAGAALGLLDRDADPLAKTQAELSAAGAQVVAQVCDVTSPEQCERSIALVRQQLGGIDVLINNAGITHLSRVGETRADVIQRVFAVNFFGALHCTLAALPALRERRGRIVVMSSVAGFAPLAGRAGYSASKHALHGLFESLRAEEVTQGVSVTMVCPSFVRTGIGEHALGADGARPTRPRTEYGVPMEPGPVADLIHRAASERRRLLLIGRVAKLSWALTRVWPAQYERMMARLLLAEQDAG